MSYSHKLFVTLATGVILGRLRLSDQPHPDPRLRPDDLRPLLSPGLRRLLHRLRARHHLVDADLIRRIPAGPDVGTHAG